MISMWSVTGVSDTVTSMSLERRTMTPLSMRTCADNGSSPRTRPREFAKTPRKRMTLLWGWNTEKSWGKWYDYAVRGERTRDARGWGDWWSEKSRMGKEGIEEGVG